MVRSITERFTSLVVNLRTTPTYNANVSSRSRSITKRLNTDFWAIDSDTSNSRYIGSYGRGTQIKDESDLDLLMKLPNKVYHQYNAYQTNGQSALLQAVRDSIRKTYSTTDIGGDGQVVAVKFTDGMVVEVVPAFLNDANNYTYPNSNNGGSWQVTDPVPEIDAINTANNTYNKKIKHLARMMRA